MIRLRLLRLIGGAALALVLAVLAVAGWAWFELHGPYAGWEGEAAEIVLEPGLHAGKVLRRLAAAGVVEHPRLARAWLSWRGGAERLTHLRAGHTLTTRTMIRVSEPFRWLD